MQSTIIFVGLHFSFISASLAGDSIVNNADRHHTRRYLGDWNFHEHSANVGVIEKNNEASTTEKAVQYSNGWRPITASKYMNHDRDPRLKNQYHETVVKIGGRRDKPQSYIPRKWKSDMAPKHTSIDFKHNSNSKIFHNTLAKSQSLPHSFLRALVPNETNILPRVRHNPYPNDRVIADSSRLYFRQYPERKKKSRIEMKEDDIMWMHYQPHDQSSKVPQFIKLKTPEVDPPIVYENDMMMQETNSDPIVTYTSSSTTSNQIHSLSPNSFIAVTAAHPSFSRNNYEVIDINNKDNFKPMTTTKKTEEVVTTTESIDDVEEWRDLYNTFYPTDKEGVISTATEPKPPTNKVEDDPRFSAVRSSTRKEAVTTETTNKRNRRLFNATKSGHSFLDEPNLNRITTEKQIEMFENEAPYKTSDKSSYLSKPIVITESETTPSQGEYYNHLFESFGGDNQEGGGKIDDDTEDTNAEQRSDEMKFENSTEIYDIVERNDNEIADDQATNQTTISTHKTERTENSTMTKDHIIDRVEGKPMNMKIRGNDDTWNFLFNMTGIQFSDLIPVTLKANIFFVKKLMVECSSDTDKTEMFDGNTFSCLKKITFTILDRAVQSDVIKISDSVSLVKENNTSVEQSSRSATDEDSDWFSSLLGRIQKLFTTHSLKIHLANPLENGNSQVEGRRRHRLRRVFPVVAGIYMTITAVLIPVVFQFMAMMGGKAFVISKMALLFALFSSFSKFFGAHVDISTNSHQHHHSSPPLPPPLPPIPYPHFHYDQHHVRRKSDKRFKRRRRHYRRVFPIMVGAYMILSTVLIPLGFKFMTLLGTKSILISKISLIIAMMGSIRKIMGYSNETPQVQYTPYYAYPPYYDPWRREEFKKSSNVYDEPLEYSHWEEIE